MKRRRKLFDLGIELRVAFEMIAIHVALEFCHHLIPLRAHGTDIQPLERLVIGLVEAGGQKGVGPGLAGGVLGAADSDDFVDHDFSL